MAGDTVKMAPQSVMMIHDASGLVIGNSRDMQEMADLLEKTSDNIAAVYAQRAGGTPEEWRTAMRAETWYSDQEAVDAGLADEVVGSEAEDPDSAEKDTMKDLEETRPGNDWRLDERSVRKEGGKAWRDLGT